MSLRHVKVALKLEINETLCKMDCQAVHTFAKPSEKKRINGLKSAKLVLKIIKNAFREQPPFVVVKKHL